MFCLPAQLVEAAQDPQPREGKQSKEEENGGAMWSLRSLVVTEVSEVTGD